MTKTSAAALLAVAGLTAAATASVDPNTYEIRVSNPVSPGTPSTTVEVWADWDSATYFAFAASEFDLLGDSTGAFSGPSSAFGDPGQQDGTISGGDVTDIVAGQLQFPPGGFSADRSDPIKIWSGTWSTTDFTARSVDLSTLTTAYSNYLDVAGSSADVTMTVVEGAGSITVVPAPASLALLGLGGLAAARRRR